MFARVKGLFLISILLVLLTAVFAQQFQTVLLKMEANYLANDEDLDQDEAKDVDGDLELLKVCDQDNQTNIISLQLNRVEAQLKSYSSHNNLVYIQSIVGAIDAPPPEQA